MNNSIASVYNQHGNIPCILTSLTVYLLYLHYRHYPGMARFSCIHKALNSTEIKMFACTHHIPAAFITVSRYVDSVCGDGCDTYLHTYNFLHRRSDMGHKCKPRRHTAANFRPEDPHGNEPCEYTLYNALRACLAHTDLGNFLKRFGDV